MDVRHQTEPSGLAEDRACDMAVAVEWRTTE